MKFLCFKHSSIADDKSNLGALVNDQHVLNLTSWLKKHSGIDDLRVPTNVSELIQEQDSLFLTVSELLSSEKYHQSDLINVNEINFLSPVLPLKNVFNVGRNYREHIIEGNIANGRPANSFPEAIEFFSKAPTTIVGHNAGVKRHASVTKLLDYEAELGIVIGQTGVNITRANAMDHVFGFTIVNDITARDLQKRHGQWFKGKNLDTSCPIGPVVIHKSAIADANALQVELEVNGELRQSDSTSSMIFSVEMIIEQLSAGLTLESGDVISTGTPKGVGFAMTPPQSLNVGDVVTARIKEIGELTNTIID